MWLESVTCDGRVLSVMEYGNDVHIARRVALRREWEELRAQEVAESRRRWAADIAARDRLEAEAVAVRLEATGRLAKLLESLEPYVDGTMGEVTVGLASVYVKAVHELAALYGLTRQPRKPVDPLPLPEPAEIDDTAAVSEERVLAAAQMRAAGLRQLEARRGKLSDVSEPDVV